MGRDACHYNETFSIRSLKKYLWSDFSVPGTALDSGKWDGKQGLALTLVGLTETEWVNITRDFLERDKLVGNLGKLLANILICKIRILKHSQRHKMQMYSLMKNGQISSYVAMSQFKEQMRLTPQKLPGIPSPL